MCLEALNKYADYSFLFISNFSYFRFDEATMIYRQLIDKEETDIVSAWISRFLCISHVLIYFGAILGYSQTTYYRL